MRDLFINGEPVTKTNSQDAKWVGLNYLETQVDKLQSGRQKIQGEFSKLFNSNSLNIVDKQIETV